MAGVLIHDFFPVPPASADRRGALACLPRFPDCAECSRPIPYKVNFIWRSSRRIGSDDERVIRDSLIGLNPVTGRATSYFVRLGSGSFRALTAVQSAAHANLTEQSASGGCWDCQWCDSSLNRQSLPPQRLSLRDAPAAFFCAAPKKSTPMGLRRDECDITDCPRRRAPVAERRQSRPAPSRQTRACRTAYARAAHARVAYDRTRLRPVGPGSARFRSGGDRWRAAG
ncbi:hypothetical protein [Azospirillum argentinense]